MPEQVAVQAQEGTCANCSKSFKWTLPEPEIVNSMRISMVVWAHPNVQRCPHCGQAYQMVLGGIGGFKAALQPVDVPNEGKLIVAPPPNLKI